jgi:pantothenate kinase
MAFVRLNKAGQSIWINSDRILYFEGIESLAQDGSKRAETKVCFGSDFSIVVDEPIEQLRHRFQ